MIEFFVPGKAKSTQSGSVMKFGGRLVPVRRGPEWTAFCKLVAMQHRPPKPLEDFLAMTAILFVAPLKNRKKMGPFPRGGPDIENALKGPLDAWEDVLYRNDKQVVIQVKAKVWAPEGQEPGLYIALEPADPALYTALSARTSLQRSS